MHECLYMVPEPVIQFQISAWTHSATWPAVLLAGQAGSRNDDEGTHPRRSGEKLREQLGVWGESPSGCRAEPAGCRAEPAGCRAEPAGCRAEPAGCRAEPAAPRVGAGVQRAESFGVTKGCAFTKGGTGLIRLDKLLTHFGCGTRRQVIDAVRRGRAKVNGRVCCDPAAKVDPEQDEIQFDGAVQSYQRHRYLLMNKPSGVITAVSDRRETVLDLIPESERRGLFPIGRLDRDTEGLLILTTDGQLCHALMSPRRRIEKVYLAGVSGTLAEDAPQQFANGLTLRDGTACRPAGLSPAGDEHGLALWRITLQEGKYHQVKRMIAAVGGHVETLRRIAVGPLSLPPGLPTGQCRPLTTEELHELFRAVGDAEHQG